MAEKVEGRSFTTAFLHGDAGVGKGSLSKGLVAELPKHGINIVHLSSGDLFREVNEEINNGGSELPYINKILGAVKRDDIDTMRAGDLVRDEAVLDMVFAAVAHHANQGMDLALLDAVCRTITQHHAYVDRFAQLGRSNNIKRIDMRIDAPEHVKLERLFGRKEDRVDDTDVEKQRARFFRIKRSTDPMNVQIRQEIATGQLDSEWHDIDAMGTKEQVLAAAVAVFLASDRVQGHVMNGDHHQYSMHKQNGVFRPDAPHIITPDRSFRRI